VGRVRGDRVPAASRHIGWHGPSVMDHSAFSAWAAPQASGLLGISLWVGFDSVADATFFNFEIHLIQFKYSVKFHNL
jgi:hypothetical protein